MSIFSERTHRNIESQECYKQLKMKDSMKVFVRILRVVQNYCTFFHRFLNPCDFFQWSYLEDKVNAEAHETVESLQEEALEHAFQELDQDMINRAIDDWMRRLDAVISAEGGHFE
uniref:Uncharacterized protein n=1 Tax=Acrobeloides nanus TaxID=290746 RepID=A0A914E1F4_9BILA